MREIKFRSWVENDRIKDSIYPFMNYRVEFMGGAINDIFATSGQAPLNPLGNKITYMQYTGLKDKNGREIYEGDVYSYELYKVFVSGGHVEETTKKSVDVVEFRDGAFCHGEELLADVLEWDESVKYEGNIYENPEILGEFSE